MAKTVTIAWTLPTTRVEGGPLDPADVKHVEAEMSADGGVNFGPLATILPSEPQQVLVPDLGIGEWHFQFRVVDTLDQPSGWHIEVATVVDDSAPNTIENVVVTIE